MNHIDHEELSRERRNSSDAEVTPRLDDRELLYNESIFRQLLESAPDAMVIANRNGKITLINSQTIRLFGYSHEEMIGQDVETLMPQRYRNNHQSHLERFFLEEGYRSMGAGLDLYGMRKDGSEFPIEISLSTIETAGEMFVASAIRDVTERKQAEETERLMNVILERRVVDRTADLQEINDELKAFTYSVSHDLRAPLRAISGFAEIIASRHRGDLNEQGRHYFDNIVEASQQMELLIDDLLSYSQLGHRSVQLLETPLSEVLNQVGRHMEGRLTEVSGNLTIAEDLPIVVGDFTLLAQIFTNLIDNAIAYRRRDVELQVEIGSRRVDQHIVVSVRDNGIGMPEEFHDKIFDIFQRLHSNSDIPGTGVGLAIVKKAANLLNGSVSAESTVDRGTTFFIKLQPSE